MNLGHRRGQPFKQAISKPDKLGPEYNPWFWNPRRKATKRPDAAFMERLHEIDPNLDVTWNPISCRWQIWTPNPKMNHPTCQGWRLLFVHNGPQGQFMPLDERVFARLYWSSVDAWGSAKAYFDNVQRVAEREKEHESAKATQEGVDKGQEYMEYTKIKNIGSGSKFTRYL